MAEKKSHKVERFSPYKTPRAAFKTEQPELEPKSEDEQGLPKPKPLYFFYHSETTGGDPHSDQIIQVAATMHNLADEPDSSFSQLVKPTHQKFISTKGKHT